MPLDISNLQISRGTLARNRPIALAAAIDAIAHGGPGSGINPPFIFAHRGCSAQAPENSFSAWDIAAAGGFGLECDWRLTADNGLVCMHDATVDRTTTSSGAVNSFTMAQLRAMDNGSKWAPHFAAERIPTFEEYLQRYPNSWLLPEVEDVNTAGVFKMARLIFAYGAESRTIMQFFEGGSFPLATAVKAAYPNLYLLVATNTGGPQPNLDKAAAAGIDWMAFDVNSAWLSADYVQSVQARGMKVVFYTIDDYASLALALGYGCDAIFSGKPFAMRRGLARLAAGTPHEMWTGQNRWMWGDDWSLTNMTAQNAAACRPLDGNCGTDVNTIVAAGAVCDGRPLPPAAASYTVKVRITMTANNADTTRWVGVQLALQQDAVNWFFAPCNGSGYTFLLRSNGNVEIGRADVGVNSSTLGTQASTPLVVGTAVPCTIVVTPTQLTFTRDDTGASVTVNDATYRGGLLGLIWSGIGARFGPIHGF